LTCEFYDIEKLGKLCAERESVRS